MTQNGVQTLREALGGPDWLWTWNGLCFGYRLGGSLFTCDGFEVGRFSGSEVYGADGRYLGELTDTDDGSRLVTSVYKNVRTVDSFTPTLGRSYKSQANRNGQGAFYCGHEDFPAPDTLTVTRSKSSAARRAGIVARLGS